MENRKIATIVQDCAESSRLLRGLASDTRRRRLSLVVKGALSRARVRSLGERHVGASAPARDFFALFFPAFLPNSRAYSYVCTCRRLHDCHGCATCVRRGLYASPENMNAIRMRVYVCAGTTCACART